MKNFFIWIFCSVVVFNCVMVSYSPAQNDKTSNDLSPEIKAKVAQAYGKMPLQFVENNGQMDSTVRYYLNAPAGSLYFTRNEIVTEIVKRENVKKNIKMDISVQTTHNDKPEPVIEHRLVLRKKYLSMSSKCKLMGIDPLPGKVNIFRGNDPSKWKKDISTCQGVKYEGLYTGVDLIFKGTNSQLVYVMEISPKANISPVRFSLEGADKLQINKSGDLEIVTKLNTFSELKPHAYQFKEGKKIEIDCQFQLKKKNQVSYKIGKYDSSLPLTIE